MKDDSLYIDHILQSINNIIEYTKDLSKQDFSRNKMVQDAVIRNFEIIGEATKKVSDDYKQVHFEVPWKAMSGMRDKLIHDYIGVDTAVIWKTIKEDLLDLKKKLEDK
ncbi:MAG TPA: DUF86 domain-containing protein [Bacteroidetes bacterium]|nr:DUF86 domain-containing protein [Bacteroidota bacterium]